MNSRKSMFRGRRLRPPSSLLTPHLTRDTAPMNFDLLIFDLDGTLIESQVDLGRAMNGHFNHLERRST